MNTYRCVFTTFFWGFHHKVQRGARLIFYFEMYDLLLFSTWKDNLSWFLFLFCIILYILYIHEIHWSIIIILLLVPAKMPRRGGGWRPPLSRGVLAVLKWGYVQFKLGWWRIFNFTKDMISRDPKSGRKFKFTGRHFWIITSNKTNIFKSFFLRYCTSLKNIMKDSK